MPIAEAPARADAARFRARMIHEGAKPDLADWETWITFYYTDPRPERTVAAMRFLSERGDLERNPQPIAVFFGRVFAQNAGSLASWVDALRSGPEDERLVTALALWFSRVAERDARLRQLEGGSARLARYVALLQSDVAPDLTTIDARQPVELDMLWASFFATGDTRFLERIVRVLPPGTPAGASALLPAAARWSLGANAAAHSAVLEFCRQEALRQPERAAALNDIVAEAERARTEAVGAPLAAAAH